MTDISHVSRPDVKSRRSDRPALTARFGGPASGHRHVMWLLLTRRFRLWLILTVLAPLATGLLRRVGLAVQRRGGPPAVSGALLKAGELGDRARATVRGRGRRR
jgi:hypothetical protein